MGGSDEWNNNRTGSSAPARRIIFVAIIAAWLEKVSAHMVCISFVLVHESLCSSNCSSLIVSPPF